MIDIDKFRITQDHRNDEYTIHFKCALCQKHVPVTIAGPDLFKWRQGAFVQELKSLTPDEREMFISATCSPCFDDLFFESEDDYRY